MTSDRRDTRRDTLRIPKGRDTAGYAVDTPGYAPPQHKGYTPAPSEGAGVDHADEYFKRMDQLLPILGERMLRTRYQQWMPEHHDMHVIDYLESEARDQHPPAMPPHQMRRDNQDYYDRIDPDRRRFRFDE